jgi:predicted  nucleic acid-binding Zn-ribbon protein
MPHQCTNCDRTFPDGSKEMLSGCPDCGGNKFRYRPDAAPADDENSPGPTDADPSGAESTPGDPPTADASPPGGETPPAAPETGAVADAVSSAATTVRDLVGGDSGRPAPPDPDPVDADAPEVGTETTPAETPADATETPAGADAESTPGTVEADVGADVDPEGGADAEDAAQASARSSVADTGDLDAGAGSDADDTGADKPDLGELREELNDQFESIRIVEPGQYELNLMELYDRQEYVISLMEDGRYAIEVPDSWRDDDR